MRYQVKKFCILILIGITGYACEQDDPLERAWQAGVLTDGFCISFNDSILLNHEEIDYYDFSTHMVYLKEPLDLLADQSISGTSHMPFTVYVQKKPAYTGSLWPSWYSSIPQGPVIQWPSFYPAYVIKIDCNLHMYTTRPDTLQDPRVASSVVDALDKYKQYREGLSVLVSDIEVSNSGAVSFTYTVTNKDNVNYYILSPEKMGSGMFHYFTNGLYLYNQENGWLEHQEEVISPEPWDSWDPDWLDLLPRHSSRQYTIIYEQFDEIPGGHYDALFRFPGLNHVDQDDIERSQGRIWLGEIAFSSKVTVY